MLRRPVESALDPEEWPEHIVQEVDQRLGSTEELGNLNGAQKGRVVYIVANGAPVAAVTYHYSTGVPLVILAADVADPLEDGGWHELEMLFSALRRVAELLEVDTDTLHWDTDCEACRELAETHGFLDRHPRQVAGRAYQLELTL